MKKLTLISSPNLLSFLGPGIPLFFDYVCFTLACLLACFLIYGIYNIQRYYRGNKCEELNKITPGYCGHFLKSNISAGNISFNEIDITEKILSVILFFVLLGFRIVSYRFAKKKDCLIDEKNTTPVDYTIMISGIPKDIDEEEIIRNFENYDLGDNRKPKVEKCNFAYYIGDYVKNVKTKMTLSKQIYQENQKEYTNDLKLKKLMRNLKKVENYLVNKALQLKGKKGQAEKSELFTGICFLTFKTQLDATEVLEKWKISFFGVFAMKYMHFLKNCFTGTKERIKGMVVRVIEPPEPQDIIWENLGTPLNEKLKRRVLTNLFSFFLLVVSFTCILLLKIWQNNLKNDSNSEGSGIFIVSILITGFISLINILLKQVMRYISVLEKYSTITGFHTGFLWKLIVVRFKVNF